MAKKGHGKFTAKGKAKPSARSSKGATPRAGASTKGQPRAMGSTSGMGHNSALC